MPCLIYYDMLRYLAAAIACYITLAPSYRRHAFMILQLAITPEMDYAIMLAMHITYCHAIFDTIRHFAGWLHDDAITSACYYYLRAITAIRLIAAMPRHIRHIDTLLRHIARRTVVSLRFWLTTCHYMPADAVSIRH